MDPIRGSVEACVIVLQFISYLPYICLSRGLERFGLDCLTGS